MTTTDLAIYVSTTRSDYRHAKALIASIQTYHPDIPILVMPDDDYAGSSMFGCPVWRPSDPRVMTLDHFYKKLRLYWGPYRHFLYLDADQIALKPLDTLFALMADMRTPYLGVNWSPSIGELWKAGNQVDLDRILSEWTGRLEWIRELDSRFAAFTHMPFGSGNMAGTTDFFDRGQMLHEFERARKLHDTKGLSEPMTRSRRSVFMGDQGFLLYLLVRSGLQARWIRDFYYWGGLPEHEIRAAIQSRGDHGWFVHWGGCPRPGPVPTVFGRRVPLESEWRSCYWRYCESARDWRSPVLDGIDQLHVEARSLLSATKRALLGRQ